MSKTTLPYLKSEVKRETQYAYAVQEDLKHLDSSIWRAMEDRVGNSARQSLNGIRSNFRLHMDDGFQRANRAVQAMEKGYAGLDRLLAQSDALLAQADAICKSLEGV